MSAKGFGVLLLLGAIWGASFMFIKVGGAEMEPFFLVEMRLALAALTLVGLGAARAGTFGLMRDNWVTLAVMGLINCALPYVLITWGEIYISSGLASIYNACTPLWGGALGFVWVWADKLSPGRLIGLFLGMAGVVLVVSGNLEQKGDVDTTMYLLGQGAVLLAALAYAISGIYGRRRLKGVPPHIGATGQLIAGSLMLLPFALFQVPSQVPSWQAIGSVATLSILGTSVATLLYFWLLNNVGVTGTLLVTYLLPGFALMWGALLLHETITWAAIAGLMLVLLGITFTTGKAGEFRARVVGRTKKQMA
ncbi:MAG: DMT family transporter [Chloroflexia bacterium]